jgi:hypothetical protein
MSGIGATDSDAVLVSAADAERIGNASQLVRLLVDSSSAQGTLSAQRSVSARAQTVAAPINKQLTAAAIAQATPGGCPVAAKALGLDHHDARAAHGRCRRRPSRKRSSALRKDV